MWRCIFSSVMYRLVCVTVLISEGYVEVLALLFRG